MQVLEKSNWKESLVKFHFIQIFHVVSTWKDMKQKTRYEENVSSNTQICWSTKYLPPLFFNNAFLSIGQLWAEK